MPADKNRVPTSVEEACSRPCSWHACQPIGVLASAFLACMRAKCCTTLLFLGNLLSPCHACRQLVCWLCVLASVSLACMLVKWHTQGAKHFVLQCQVSSANRKGSGPWGQHDEQFKLPARVPHPPPPPTLSRTHPTPPPPTNNPTM